MTSKTLGALTAATLSAGLWLGASPAAACGGFFCNNQAIDQAGEDILFSINQDGTVTTVVQIQYTGPSETFAWILPVPAEPTVSVGTDELFRQLRARTNPVFTTELAVEGTCRDEPDCWRDFPEFDNQDPSGGWADGGAGAQDAAPAPGVDVRLRAHVGPFDVAVLAAGSGDALRTWLTDNEYLIPASAGAELDHYVALNHFFVALRLIKDRSAGEIQPIVLTSDNDEPCVPIRLTRIAAVPDMPIRVYFLAEQRYRPFNYMLVNPDLDQFGLWSRELRYEDLVTDTVNDAGGQAFVTDFAGNPPSVRLEIGDVEFLREVTDPKQMMQQLQGTSLTGDNQLLSILLRNLPPPDGVDPQQFYNCLARGWCEEYDEYLTTIVFDPNSLVNDLNEQIIEPRRVAQEMVESHGHLTRLFTTMSAEEMTVDPMFQASTELPREHSNVHVATRTRHCSGDYFDWTAPTSLTLPSGRTMETSPGVVYRGTDREYCEDRGEGFRPSSSMDRLQEIAETRNTRLRGGGGGCSASPGASGLGLGALAFGLLAFVWRRRSA